MKYLVALLLSAVAVAALESPDCAMDSHYQEVEQTKFHQDRWNVELEQTQNHFTEPKADDAVSIKYYDISCFSDNSINRFYTTLWPIMVRSHRGRYNYVQSVDEVNGKRTYIDDDIPAGQVEGKGYLYSPVQSHKSAVRDDILKFSIQGWFGGLMIPILHDRENTKLDKNVVIEIVARDYLFQDFARYCNPNMDAQGYRCDATFYVNATLLLGNVQALEASKIREAIRVGPLDKGSQTVLLTTNAKQASVFDYCEKRELSSPWEIIAAIKTAYEYICMVPGMPICSL